MRNKLAGLVIFSLVVNAGVLVSTAHAQITHRLISGGAGYFGAIDSSQQGAAFYEGSGMLATPDGVGAKVSVGYSKYNNQKSSIVPVDFSALYLFNPRQEVFPYIGGGVGLNRIRTGSISKDSELGYNALAGFMFRIGHTAALVIEGKYRYLKVDTTDLSNYTVTIGYAFDLSEGAQHPIIIERHAPAPVFAEPFPAPPMHPRRFALREDIRLLERKIRGMEMRGALPFRIQQARERLHELREELDLLRDEE